MSCFLLCKASWKTRGLIATWIVNTSIGLRATEFGIALETERTNLVGGFQLDTDAIIPATATIDTVAEHRGVFIYATFAHMQRLVTFDLTGKGIAVAKETGFA